MRRQKNILWFMHYRFTHIHKEESFSSENTVYWKQSHIYE